MQVMPLLVMLLHELQRAAVTHRRQTVGQPCLWLATLHRCCILCCQDDCDWCSEIQTARRASPLLQSDDVCQSADTALWRSAWKRQTTKDQIYPFGAWMSPHGYLELKWEKPGCPCSSFPDSAWCCKCMMCAVLQSTETWRFNSSPGRFCISCSRKQSLISQQSDTKERSNIQRFKTDCQCRDAIFKDESFNSY